jgi:hypothetical protein
MLTPLNQALEDLKSAVVGLVKKRTAMMTSAAISDVRDFFLGSPPGALKKPGKGMRRRLIIIKKKIRKRIRKRIIAPMAVPLLSIKFLFD